MMEERLEGLGWAERVRDWYVPRDKGWFDALVRFPTGPFARLTPDGTQYWNAANGRTAPAKIRPAAGGRRARRERVGAIP